MPVTEEVRGRLESDVNFVCCSEGAEYDLYPINVYIEWPHGWRERVGSEDKLEKIDPWVAIGIAIGEGGASGCGWQS